MGLPEKFDVLRKTLKGKPLKALLRSVFEYLDQDQEALKAVSVAYSKLSVSGVLDSLDVFIPRYYHKALDKFFVGSPLPQLEEIPQVLRSHYFSLCLGILAFTLRPLGFEDVARKSRITAFVPAPAWLDPFFGVRFMGWSMNADPLVIDEVRKYTARLKALAPKQFNQKVQELGVPQDGIDIKQGRSWVLCRAGTTENFLFDVSPDPTEILRGIAQKGTCPICGGAMPVKPPESNKPNYVCQSSVCKMRFKRLLSRVSRRLEDKADLTFEAFKQLLKTVKQEHNSRLKVIQKNMPDSEIWEPDSWDAMVNAL